MSPQSQVDAGAMVASPNGLIENKLPIEVKCSWQVRQREGCTSLQALVSDDSDERRGVYLPFAQLIGYSVSALCFLHVLICRSIWLVDFWRASFHKEA